MRFSVILSIAAGLTILTPVTALAGDVKIIANPGVKVDSISASELKSVFLQQRKTLKDGSLVKPVFVKSGPAHQTFLRQYLDQDEEEVRDYFRSLAFTGRGTMPKELNSEEEVVAYVASTRGAIGYVSATTAAEGVKTLGVASGSNKSERTLLVRVDPEYPETLRRLNIFITGTVRLELTVSPQGKVENVFLLAGNPALGQAAISAVRQWIYAPGSTQTTIRLTIGFDSPR